MIHDHCLTYCDTEGIGYYWTGAHEQIISIDATTGVTSVIATLDLDWVGSGFTVDSINHKAYLAGQKNGETFWRLYNTDLATGEVVSTTILDTGQGGFGFAAYAANTLIGYYWTGAHEQIISIDATTGVTSVIATLDLDWVGLGFTVDSINHKAYLAGQKNGETFWRLYNTDLATGEVVSTTILDTGQGGFGLGVYALASLEQVTISGPTRGVVQTGYTFTSTVSPITATQPITYVWQATEETPITNTGGLSSTVSFTWDLPGTQVITVTATNVGGTVTGTYVITVVEGTQTTVNPGTGGTLAYTGTQGLTTTIQIPPGSVAQTTTLVYVPVQTATAPSGFVFAGHAFDLNAYQDGTLLLSFVFLRPVTVTLYYTDTDVAGLDENALKLHYLDASIWKDVAGTCTPTSTYDRRPVENRLSVPICHLSRFALLGSKRYAVYLPLIMKN